MTSQDPSESTAYLAAIVESSDDAIISKDLFGTIKSFNRGAERMFGYTAAEIVGKPVTTLIPESLRDEETTILARLRKGERIDHYETVRITKDRRLIEVSLTVSPVRNAAGEIVGASKIARDITERNQAARALAAQREWFRTTLGSIGDGVIASDATGRVTFLNPVAESLTGWTAKEAEGRVLEEVFEIRSEKTGERAENPVHEVLRTGRIVGLSNHIVLVKRGGGRTPIADSAAPIKDEGGRVIGMVLVFRNVMHERMAEADRRTAAAERERLLAAERSARAEAEKASKTKDDFVAMVSHELRTPLNAIVGWTDLLGRSRVDEGTLRQGLDVIARNARVQTQLVSDLLDISRIVAGKLNLDVAVVELAALVKGTVETMRHPARAKSIDLRLRLAPSACPVVGDSARLSQIVWNLLSNAIKFTPEGGLVEVELKTSASTATIEITDTGIGIAPEDLPTLFERFRQVGPIASRRFGGLGIGLSIAKHLAEMHSGSISVESEGPGKGSRFSIELPLSSAPAHTLENRDAAAARTVSLQGVRVLVVEDDADMRELLERLLVSHGATVASLRSGEQALSALGETRPHLIVSDIGLPDMSGYDLMTTIRRRDDEFAFVPAIALTAFARGQDRTHALRAGYQVHIAKPFDADELVATVASLAEVSRRRDLVDG
jgi:PAS domain S-box-containing protein